jgi:hypothetical protein
MATLSAAGRLAVEVAAASTIGHGITGVEMLHSIDGLRNWVGPDSLTSSYLPPPAHPVPV